MIHRGVGLLQKPPEGVIKGENVPVEKKEINELYLKAKERFSRSLAKFEPAIPLVEQIEKEVNEVMVDAMPYLRPIIGRWNNGKFKRP